MDASSGVEAKLQTGSLWRATALSSRADRQPTNSQLRIETDKGDAILVKISWTTFFVKENVSGHMVSTMNLMLEKEDSCEIYTLS